VNDVYSIFILVIFECARSFETRESRKIRRKKTYCGHRMYNFPLLVGEEDVDKL